MADEEHHLDQERLVKVKVVHNEVEANVIRSLLESAGIRCVLMTPVPRNIYPFTVDGLAAVNVCVLDTDVDEAKAIIEESAAGIPLEEDADPR